MLNDNDNDNMETVLYSDAGASESADMVQASRSIVLHLKEGDRLKLKKIHKKQFVNPSQLPVTSTEAVDRFLTLCISLKHLDSSLNLNENPAPATPDILKELKTWMYLTPEALHTSAVEDPTAVERPHQGPVMVVSRTEETTPTRPTVTCNGVGC